MRRLAVVLVALFVGVTSGPHAQSATVVVNGQQLTFGGQIDPEAIRDLAAQLAGSQAAQFNGQPTRDNRPQTGTSSVRGRIVSDTGQPLRRVVVQLRGAPTPHATTTDVDGRYAFDDLPAGHYTVSAGRTGYINTPSEPFDLADNQRVDNVNVRVPHGGVITGQILDEFGEPLAGATVSPMRQTFVNGQKRVVNAGQTTITNDIGEYRLFGLMPGIYYVAVSPRNDSLTMTTALGPPGPAGPPAVMTTTTSAPDGYAQMYYPGTPDSASAQPITVAAAQTVASISFSLTSVRLAKVSGVAFDDQGRPVTRGGVNLMPRNSPQIGGIGTSGPLRPDGSFSISNVPPGSYYVRANILPAGPVAPPAPGTPPTPPQFAIAPITVAGDDVTGLVLTPMRPAVLRGRLTFDDPGAAASIKPSTVRIVAQRLDVNGPPLVNVASSLGINDDFSFEVNASPEHSALRAIVPISSRGPGDMAAWRLRAVYVHGQDVTDTGFDLASGTALEDIEIAMTTKVETVSGTVTMPDGTPAKNVPVVIFAAERELWSAPSGRYIGRASTQSDGTFKVLSLPPGDYYATAVPAALSPAPDWNDPDVLEAATRTATRFSVVEGGSAALDLKLSR